MATAFTVQAATNTLGLDATRGGRVSFTVTNRTGRAVRARATIVPQSADAAAWLKVAGPSERDLPADGSDQVVVDVAVPEGVPEATHAFLLRMVAVSAPDEEWGDSQLVSFTTPPPPAPPVVVEEPPGYVETLLGGLAGGAIVAILVAIIGVVGLATGGSSTPSGAGPGTISDTILELPVTDICSTVACTDEELDRCELINCTIRDIDRCGTAALDCQIAICRIVACPTAPPVVVTPTPTPPDPGPPIGALAVLGLAEVLLPAAGAAFVLARRRFLRVPLTALPVGVLLLVLGLPIFLGVLAATGALRPSGPGPIVAGVVAAVLAVVLPALGGRAFARRRSVGHL